MLTASFFVAIFTSLCWLMYIGLYLGVRFGNAGFGAMGLTDMFLYTAVATAPLFIIWMIFACFCRFAESRRQQKQFQLLLQQQHGNQEYFEMIGRILLQTEQSRQDDFVVGKIDLFIAEMNELLADLMERYSLVSSEKIKIIWANVKNGNRWSFAKAIIEINNNVENFADKIFATARKDALLAGIIGEFCARYGKLVALLQQHDREKVFLEIIESGALGRVFAIFAPIVERLTHPETEGLAELTAKPDEDEAAASRMPELILPTEDEPEAEEIILTAAEEVDEDELKEDKDSTLDDDEADTESIISILSGTEAESEPEVEPTEDSAERGGKRSPFKLPKLSQIFKWQKEDDNDDWINTKGDIDPLTLALERSFGRLSDNKPELPLRNLTAADADRVSEPAENSKFAFANTDKTIKNLQKEWEEMKKDKSGESAETVDLEAELDNITIADPEEETASDDGQN